MTIIITMKAVMRWWANAPEKSTSLDEEVRVRVADTDRLMRTIDFVIAKERDEENGEDEW